MARIVHFGPKYFIGDPIESEGSDQALVLVTGRLDGGLFDLANGIVPTRATVGCISDMHRSSSDCTQSSVGDSDGEFEATYWVVREDDAWKLVLHDGLVREMQKLTPRITVRRYTPNIAVAQAGLTIRIQAVDLQTESTTMRLRIDNANDVEADLRNALSLASLTDDRGVTFNTRILRSVIPETVPAHSSVVADLAFVGDLSTFTPVPIDARQLSLSLPYVRVRDRELTLHLDITLRPLPHAEVARKSIPGEPVLVYLRTLFSPRFTTDETLKTLYQTFLSSETRSLVTEQEFVDYHRSAAFDAWLCQLGVPDDFTIGLPAYPSPDQASILVATGRERRPPAPVKGAPEALTFRVVKEAETWKLALQEDLVKDIKAHPPLIRRYRLGVENWSNGVHVVVHEVELDTNRAIVQLSLGNSTDHDISYNRDEAFLTGRGGGVYSLRMRRWFYLPLSHIILSPSYGFPSYTETLELDPIPLEARDLTLTLGSFDDMFSVSVRIVLDPIFACP